LGPLLNVPFKELAEYFDVTPDAVRKLVRNSKPFIKLLKDSNIQIITKKGRYGGSFFVVPESQNPDYFLSKEGKVKIM